MRLLLFPPFDARPDRRPQTTFCTALIQHLQHSKRSCFYVNLDPAAEDFAYEPDLDIKELISLEDVMEEMGLGPNGGLIYCFEFLMNNPAFLHDALEPLPETTLIIIDMPGQIELYTHIPVVPQLVKTLTTAGSLGINLCATYLLESTSALDTARFFAGTLSAMSAMLMLEIPHVNVLSKMDLVKGVVPKKQLKRFIDPDSALLEESSDPHSNYPSNPLLSTPQHLSESAINDPSTTESLMTGSSFKALNRAVAQLIDDFSMVSFLQLDSTDEDSVGAILSYIDDAIQYHEAQEPKEPNDAMDEGDGGAYWEDGG